MAYRLDTDTHTFDCSSFRCGRCSHIARNYGTVYFKNLYGGQEKTYLYKSRGRNLAKIKFYNSRFLITGSKKQGEIKMKKNNTKDIIKIAIVAAIYAVMTVAISPLSYGPIQLRFSEILVLLCFYNRKYCVSMTVGCFIANIFSPMALLDVPFGTLATILAVLFLSRGKNLFVGSLWATIFNGIIIGTELYIAFKEPILISMGTVAVGEFIVVSIIGVLVFKAVEKNKHFMKLIGNERKS